jgi:hypothetical protein
MPSLSGRGGNRKQYGKLISSGLILQYDMQNMSSYSGSGTTVTDIRGNSSATLNNGPTFNSTRTKYLTFDGTNDYLIINTSLNSKLSPANTSRVISFACWVYPMDNGVLISEHGSSTIPPPGWHASQIEVVSSTIKMSVWPHTSIITSPTITFNQWNYLVLVCDGTSVKGYQNGSLFGTSGTFTRLTPYNDGASAGLFYALAYGDSTSLGDGSYANCRIGAFHVYNNALTSEQILENFNKTRSIYGI